MEYCTESRGVLKYKEIGDYTWPHFWKNIGVNDDI